MADASGPLQALNPFYYRLNDLPSDTDEPVLLGLVSPSYTPYPQTHMTKSFQL